MGTIKKVIIRLDGIDTVVNVDAVDYNDATKQVVKKLPEYSLYCDFGRADLFYKDAEGREVTPEMLGLID